MGHFTINLPDGRQGDVRFGTVRKKTLFPNFFSKDKTINESKTGYVIRIEKGKCNEQEYWLYRSKEDKWSKDPDGINELDTDMYIFLKNAIIQKETFEPL